MKKLLAIIVLTMISCNKADKKETDNFDESVREYVKTTFFTNPKISMDSLWLVQKENLTDKSEMDLYTIFASNEIQRLYNEGESDRVDMQLYNTIEATDLMKIKQPQIEKRNDSMKYFQNLMNKAHDKRKSMDSTKINGYLVNYVYKATNQISKESLQDTLEFVVLKDNSILNSYDYIKRITPKITK